MRYKGVNSRNLQRVNPAGEQRQICSLHTLHILKDLLANGYAHHAMQNSMQEIQREADLEDLELRELLDKQEGLLPFEILTIECISCGRKQKLVIFYVSEDETFTVPESIDGVIVRMRRGGSYRTHKHVSRYLRVDSQEKRFTMLMANRELLRYLFSIVMRRLTCSTLCNRRVKGIKKDRRSIATLIATVAYGTADERIKEFSGRLAILL